jgi:hypothetical protein
MFPHFAAHRPQSGRIFLLLANFGKEGRPEPIVGKFSQEMLAEMIGTTRSRVSFFHEQVPQVGVHRIQRKTGSAQFLAERGVAPQARESSRGHEAGLCEVEHKTTSTSRDPEALGESARFARECEIFELATEQERLDSGNSHFRSARGTSWTKVRPVGVSWPAT